MLNIKHVTHKLCVDTQQQQQKKQFQKQNDKIVKTLDQRHGLLEWVAVLLFKQR